MASEAECIIGLYERHARAFARDRAFAHDRRLPEAEWLGRFLALLPPEGHVLDIGCGSGDPIARHVAAAGLSITGIDASPTLIGLCAAAVPAGRWHVADMRQLALGRTFDGLIAWDSLFHLSPDDQRAMFPVFARHAGARAALLFNSGPRHGVAIGSYRGEPLYHASLDPAEYRALLAREGFAVAAHAVEDPACGGRTVWLAVRAPAALGQRG